MTGSPHTAMPGTDRLPADTGSGSWWQFPVPMGQDRKS